MSNLTYYKKNVKYVVGGRMFLGDPQGFTLTNENPYISVKADELRNFKVANKRALVEGLLIEVEEPNVEWETTNAISDEEISTLLKQYVPLKQTLAKINSLPLVVKILEAAKDAERPPKTIKLIESRVAELAEDEEIFKLRGE